MKYRGKYIKYRSNKPQTCVGCQQRIAVNEMRFKVGSRHTCGTCVQTSSGPGGSDGGSGA